MFSVIKLRLLRLRDEYLVFVMMTAMALGLTFVFGTSFDHYKPTVLIVDEDHSYYSGLFVNEVTTYGAFSFKQTDYQIAVKEVEEGNVLTSVVIKQGFAAALKNGQQISLGIIKVKDSVEGLTLERLLTGTAAKMSGSIRISEITSDFIAAHKAAADRQKIAVQAYAKVMEAWKYKRPLTVSTEAAETTSNNGYDGLKHAMIGFALFFSMYTMVFGIGTILYDRQYKTWQRMLVSPVSRASILGGSLVAAYLIGALQLGVLILAGNYLFGIDWGPSLGGVLTVAAAFVFAVTCLGLFLASLVKTHAQLSAVTPVILTSTAMLGGCMWPLEIVNSRFLLALANLTPQKWALQGMESIATYGQGFAAAVIPSLVLLGMGMLFFAAGVKLANQ